MVPLNNQFQHSHLQETGTYVSLARLDPEVEDSVQSVSLTVTSAPTTATPRLQALFPKGPSPRRRRSIGPIGRYRAWSTTSGGDAFRQKFGD